MQAPNQFLHPVTEGRQFNCYR